MMDVRLPLVRQPATKYDRRGVRIGGDQLLSEELKICLTKHRLVAVIRSKSPEDALIRAKKAVDAGVQVLEIAWTTPDAANVLKEAVKLPAVVGAGTITTAEQTRAASHVGAEFLVAPNFSDEVARTASTAEIAYVPGVLTPRDVVDARAASLRLLKLFPAATVGLSHLVSLREPFPDVEWIPTGGITWDTAFQWLQGGALAVGMGSALFKADDVTRAIQEIRG